MQIHTNGLKFGIYQDYGTKTCAGYPGIIGYEELDANLFASWGVDYVKLDGCNSEPETMDEGYIQKDNVLDSSIDSILFRLCGIWAAVE